MSDDVVSVDEQADIISEFLEGLLDSLGIEGDINRTKVDDETVELGVEGADLGLLIGPKGQTLTAVHELSRTVLQRRATGRHDGRVRIDIGGYRQRRQEALARFVRQQAEEVVAQGVSRALEPMNAVDRKVVHDTINEIDGVSTLSEGIDPNRRVVIVVEGSEA
ncbi:MAG: R3H domain-containing nucleic acid-binding protein [Acidimicrobiales bacterium]